MKIVEILNEGIIKVPNETYLDVMRITCGDLFSRVFAYIDTSVVQENYPELESIYSKKYKQSVAKYGRFSYKSTGDTTSTVHVRMGEVDPKYFKQNARAVGQTYSLVVVVTMSDHADGPHAEYRLKRAGKAAKIVVYLPAQNYLERIIRAPELFDSLLDELEGVVEHELIHAIQDMALKMPDDSDENSPPDEYYQSEIEFSPLITSEYKSFIAYVKKLRALGYPKEKIDVKALMLKFVNPDAPSIEGFPVNVSEFFSTLYDKDKTKWKKAIKYFYGLFSKQ